MESATTPKTPWYLTRRTAVLALVLVGPLGLPLVWLSPRFSFRSKVVITAATVVLTVLLYWHSVAALQNLQEALEAISAATR